MRKLYSLVFALVLLTGCIRNEESTLPFNLDESKLPPNTANGSRHPNLNLGYCDLPVLLLL